MQLINIMNIILIYSHLLCSIINSGIIINYQISWQDWQYFEKQPGGYCYGTVYFLVYIVLCIGLFLVFC